MTEYAKVGGTTLHLGDCRDVLREMPDNSVDAVVTDPPYELAFMGRGWDAAGIAFQRALWEDVLRVLKPGGHLVAFGGTRTYHRMVVAIEDAGFEVRDCLMYMYASGFPKSLDVSKAIDRVRGAQRAIIGPGRSNGLALRPGRSTYVGEFTGTRPPPPPLTAPATEAARQWDGWGTALKPGHEIVLLAQRPKLPSGELRRIVEDLNQMEARLWSLLPANTADETSKSSRSASAGECGSALWTAVERLSTRDDLCARMDTSLYVSALHTSLSTVSSWQRTLDVLSAVASTSTIETASGLTTDLKTLSACLLALTPRSIILGLAPGHGLTPPVSTAVQAFAAAETKWSAILTLSALADAIEPRPTCSPDEDAEVGFSPAVEPICLARKPLSGTVAETVLEWGTGALNVDGCRLATEDRTVRHNNGGTGDISSWRTGARPSVTGSPAGRWPANVLLDEGAAALLDEAGEATTSRRSLRGKGLGYHGGEGEDTIGRGHDDSGGPSRFFFTAKTAKRERHVGCDDLLWRRDPSSPTGVVGVTREEWDALPEGERAAGNIHPTVKPLDLMRWLVRLATPPGGMVLDPFVGSGTTAMACEAEGFGCVGMDLHGDHLEIARRRIAAVHTLPERRKAKVQEEAEPKPAARASRSAADALPDLFSLDEAA